MEGDVGQFLRHGFPAGQENSSSYVLASALLFGP
jgi:hypothetical protein